MKRLFFLVIQQTLQFLGLTADPSNPQNGAIWYRTDLGKFRGRENGVSKDLIGVGGGGGGLTNTQVQARIRLG